MANIADGRAAAGVAAVETWSKAMRVTPSPRGFSYGVAGTTGTIAAGLAANGALWSMRSNPAANRRVFFERLRLQFTTLAAFTTPVTAGRRLQLVRSTVVTANPSGGAALLPLAKDVTDTDSIANAAGGGDMRVATTAALTMTGVTLDTANVFRQMLLVHCGAAGAFFDCIWEFHATENAPIILEPGQVLAIVAGQTMDAGGTFQLSVNADWHEAALWDAVTSE